MVTDKDLGWLAGLFDGEGSICLQRAGKYKYPRIDIVNTERKLLEKAQAILDQLEIDSGLTLKNAETVKYKAAYQLWIKDSPGVCRFFC